MKHVFEKDANNATINPLYIQKNTSVETTTTETNIKLSYHWIIFRAILFLIIPIIVLWLLIPNYDHIYVYIWISYVLIAQATILYNIIDENNNNIHKRRDYTLSTHLHLGGNKITDIGIEKLVPALKEMKGMIYLYLYNNNITNAGKNQILEVCKSYKNVEHCAV